MNNVNLLNSLFYTLGVIIYSEIFLCLTTSLKVLRLQEVVTEIDG